MKTTSFYIRICILLILILTITDAITDYFWGAHTRVINGSYGPLSMEEIGAKLIPNIILFSILSIIAVIFMYQNDKYQLKKRQQQKKSPLKDPILDKIIDGALSGKTTDDILKTQNNDSEIEKDGDDDNKEYQ